MAHKRAADGRIARAATIAWHVDNVRALARARKRGQQGVALPAATECRSIAVMVGLEGAFLGDVDVGGLFWRQFG